MKHVIGFLAALVLSGCSPEPMAATEAYLIVPAPDDAIGWAVVDRLKQELPEADRRRIGVPTILSDKSSTLLIPFVGDCKNDRALVDHMTAIAAMKGVSGTRCDAIIPG